MKPVCFFLLLVFVASSGAAQQNVARRLTNDSAKRVFRYTNPITRDTAISMRDHFIIKAGKKWYCVGTSEPVWTGPNPGVRLLESDDLIHWIKYPKNPIVQGDHSSPITVFDGKQYRLYTMHDEVYVYFPKR